MIKIQNSKPKTHIFCNILLKKKDDKEANNFIKKFIIHSKFRLFDNYDAPKSGVENLVATLHYSSLSLVFNYKHTLNTHTLTPLVIQHYTGYCF